LYPEEIAAGLETRWLAREIQYFEEVDSTNRVALELAQAGAAHGTTVIAESQNAGRGRLGRSFFSPPGTNLYTSIVLRPEITTASAPTWILAAAVGVAKAIEETVGKPDEVTIKWPNDVLLSGLKTSGILMELAAEAARVSFLVLGIGVNLNVDRQEFPEEFQARATSLASFLGHPVDRLSFVRCLCAHLEQIFDLTSHLGFEGVIEQFETRFQMRGQQVCARELDGSKITGVALGIDSDGALRIREACGKESRVIAADVTLAEELS
jgi:BirA family biotin operon repressor/biotin-[acetyl-CoA-carboxylase] ligase